MLRQQTPNPGRSRRVSTDEWLRTRMSAPLNTPAFHRIALAGGSTSSAGVPETMERPGDRESVGGGESVAIGGGPFSKKKKRPVLHSVLLGSSYFPCMA